MQGLACMYAPNMDLNYFTLVNQRWTTRVLFLAEHTPACWKFEHRNPPGSFAHGLFSQAQLCSRERLSQLLRVKQATF